MKTYNINDKCFYAHLNTISVPCTIVNKYIVEHKIPDSEGDINECIEVSYKIYYILDDNVYTDVVPSYEIYDDKKSFINKQIQRTKEEIKKN